MQKSCRIKQALIKDKRYPNLYLLPSAQTRDKTAVSPEQMVKLIRSKGVGIYFVTQSPKDIPDGVLAQLGNKIQHALHAYTPAEQKKAKAAAASFRENPEFDTY